jgi:hypothetical protein
MLSVVIFKRHEDSRESGSAIYDCLRFVFFYLAQLVGATVVKIQDVVALTLSCPAIADAGYEFSTGCSLSIAPLRR